ncbi:hypothetical protein D3C81_1323010 [compost metagenome]
MRDARMRRQFGHGLTVTGQRFAIQRSEAFQQILSLCIGSRRWHVEPHQLFGFYAPTSQLQGQPGEVRRKNFRTAIGRQLLVLILGPQAITHARLQAPGPARALGGAGLGNALGVETGHAAAGVETRHPRQPGIDHHAHAVDGQTGLGDVGGQHHFALARRCRIDRGPLRGEVQFTVQRAQ